MIIEPRERSMRKAHDLRLPRALATTQNYGPPPVSAHVSQSRNQLVRTGPAVEMGRAWRLSGLALTYANTGNEAAWPAAISNGKPVTLIPVSRAASQVMHQEKVLRSGRFFRRSSPHVPQQITFRSSHLIV